MRGDQVSTKLCSGMRQPGRGCGRPALLAGGLALALLQPVAVRPVWAEQLNESPADSDPRRAALELSKRALDAYLAGRYAEAERLYADAWRLWPAEALYLYNAARAAERAAHLEAAERMYSLYLDKAPPDQAEIAKARLHLAEIRSLRKPAPAAKAAPPSTGPSSALGLGILLTGGVVAVGGGLLLGSAAADQTELDTRLGQRDASGAIVGISHADALARQNAINTGKYIGWGLVGGGALAGIAGAVLLAKAPASKVAVLPDVQGRGVLLTLRF